LIKYRATAAIAAGAKAALRRRTMLASASDRAPKHQATVTRCPASVRIVTAEGQRVGDDTTSQIVVHVAAIISAASITGHDRKRTADRVTSH
jgi:hypothetical protein